MIMPTAGNTHPAAASGLKAAGWVGVGGRRPDPSPVLPDPDDPEPWAAGEVP
jgi:hypothetical protein